MSTFKKVLSLVLCMAMIFSTVAVAGFAADTTETYYAGNESVIDTLADFEALGYDKTQQKFYMYLGVDYYEQNEVGEWVLTDHYVQPGAQLRGEVYFKTNMYTGSGMAIYFNFDRNFFDVTNGKGATYPATANSYDPDKVKYPTENYPYNIAHNAGDGAAINEDNPIVAAEEINFKYTTKWARNIPGFKEATNANFHGIPLAESDEWDFWYVNVGTGTVNSYAFEFETDEYFFTFDVKVREFMPDGVTKLADGTTGNVTVDKRCWTIYDNAAHAGTNTASRRVGNIGTYPELIKESSIKRMNLQTWFTIDDFYIDDCNHTFTIGELKGSEVKVTDGDTVLFEGELLPGAALTLETIPAKENYVFVGLSDGTTTYPVDSETGEVQGFKMGAEAVALTAVFEGKPVTAVFNYNDGVTANLTTTIKYNDVVADDANYPADPTRENYTFNGWAVNGTVIDGTFTMPATTTTFVAQWVADEADYTVNYYTMGEDGQYGEPVVETFSAGIGATVAAVQNAPEGYFVDTALSTLEGTVAADGSLVLSVYYARAQKPVYTITFDADGGSAVEAISAEEGTSVSAPTAPTKLGYEFKGWVDANGDAVEFPYELTADVALKATWSVLQYTITYYVDGEEYDSVTADFGAAVVAPEDPTKTGYIFTEWYPAVPETMPAEDLALDAHFVAGKFDAVFYADGEIYKTVKGVEFNTAITAPDAPIKTGYTFIGWEPEVGVMDEEGKEFEAIFEVNQYTVSFNTDGGNETIDPQTLDYGSAVEEPATPTKAGYTFAGWTLQNSVVDFAQFTVPANNVTLKATWTANTYKASFYANKGDAEAYNVVDIKYGARLNCAAPEAPSANLYFDGWYNAETDEAASANAGTALGNYLVDGDSAYYAKWTEYPHKIIIKAKNFTTGEWTDIETLYGKSGSVSVNKLKEIKASVNVAEDLAWDGKVSFARGDNYTSMSFNETYASADIITEPVAFEGTKVLYLHAFPIFELEYQLPVYDEATGKYTDEYTTAVKEFKATSFVESAQININKRDVVPATGYVFDTWTTADGATPTFFDSGSNYVFTLSRANGSKLTIKASFKLEVYEIRFLIGTSDAQAVMPVGINTIGAVLNADTAEFVYATGENKGQTRKLPEVGKVNEEMAEPVPGKGGHKLLGWYLTNPDELIDINNFEITPELAAKAIVPTSGNKYILVNSKWEAQNYDAKFYFWAEGSTIENPIYTEEPIVVSAPVGTGRDDLVKMFSDADIAKLNASVPEGVTLSTTWRNEDGSTVSNSLAVGGSKYYAVYDTVQIRVYVDWNSKEDDSDWLDVTDQNVRYGDDTMRGEYNSVDRGVYHYVTAGLSISNLERPTPAHEIVGWKTYHVKDYTTVKDTSTWIEGTNDAGTTIAMDTIVYQAQWKEHKDFLFRVYDMSGNLSMALGKNFKMYYWKDSRIADKDRATLKTIDSMIILLLVPKFENGSLRLDPFYLAKDLFQLKNIGGLFKAIFTAIGTLIKGT